MTNRILPVHSTIYWGLSLIVALAPTIALSAATEIPPGQPAPIPYYRSGFNEFGLPPEQGPQHGRNPYPSSPRQFERDLANLRQSNAQEELVRNATELFDQRVATHTGEEIGPIEDMIIDTQSGRVEFAAVGPGEPLRIIPLQALRHRPDQGLIEVRITEDQWNRAPSLRRDQLPQLADDQAQAVRDVYRFYGVPYRGPARVAEPQPTFGAPAQRSQQRQIPQTRLPGDPPGPEAVPPIIPPDQTDVHPEVRREREFRAPAELPEDEMDDLTADEWRGRPFAEETAPTMDRAPARGPRGVPHRTRPVPSSEFGARPDRAEADRAMAQLPTAESLHWITDLMEQAVTGANQQPLGIIADFRIGTQAGQISHAIVWNETDQQQYAIPMNAIRIDPEDRITAAPSIDELQRSPRFDERQARRRPMQTFRYDQPAEPEFGAPERREPETTN